MRREGSVLSEGGKEPGEKNEEREEGEFILQHYWTEEERPQFLEKAREERAMEKILNGDGELGKWILTFSFSRKSESVQT